MSNKTFLRITNRDIFNKLESIETKLNKINGKVLMHTWAIGFIVLILVAVIKSLL